MKIRDAIKRNLRLARFAEKGYIRDNFIGLVSFDWPHREKLNNGDNQ